MTITPNRLHKKSNIQFRSSRRQKRYSWPLMLLILILILLGLYVLDLKLIN